MKTYIVKCHGGKVHAWHGVDSPLRNNQYLTLCGSLIGGYDEWEDMNMSEDISRVTCKRCKRLLEKVGDQ